MYMIAVDQSQNNCTGPQKSVRAVHPCWQRVLNELFAINIEATRRVRL